MERVKLGIIGCGIAARDLHWPALQKLTTKFEIAMVCNHTEKKAKDFSQIAGGVPYVLNYQDLLKNPGIEAVDIVLPIELNYPVTRDALKASKHVIVEKPLAKNLKQGMIMRQFPKQFNQVMMVAENFRYKKPFLLIKEMLNKEKIGRPYAVLWNVNMNITPDNKTAQTHWRINHQYPAGFVTDGGIHYIAGLRLLCGEIITGNAFLDSINSKIGKADTFSLQFQTENEINGIFNIFYSSKGFSEDRLIIYGTAGNIIFSKGIIYISRLEEKTQKQLVEDDNGFYGEFLNFYQAIREKKKIVSTFEEGYKDLQIILSAVKSAETGRRFNLKG